jgi:hemolysin activation/secretion protein
VRDAIGRRLGGKGVNIVLARVQDAIMGKGYATTRVVAPPQDIKTGVLKFKVIPGVVSDLVLSEKSGKAIYLYPMVPVRKQKLLNVRDLEQGLENLRRIPTVQTDFKLIPGEKTGESKVEITRTQKFPVRVMLSADDSGSKYTGKNQGTATLFIDNMLGLSDMFYASVGTNLERRHNHHGTDNYSFYYSVPCVLIMKLVVDACKSPAVRNLPGGAVKLLYTYQHTSHTITVEVTKVQNVQTVVNAYVN